MVLPAAARAQEEPSRDEWDFVVGAGGGITPEYEGSEDYDLVPFASLRAQRGPFYVALTGPELRANVVASESVQFGPLLRYRGKRDGVTNNAVDALEEVDAVFEVGAFAEVDLDGWLIKASVVQDLAGGHDGLLATAGACYRFRVSETLSLTGLASTSYASGDYMSSYFGIDAADSIRSGLDTFDADAGFKDVGLSVTAQYQLSDAWALLGIASYERLVGDAADSPVVDDEGDPNQLFGVVGLTYAF